MKMGTADGEELKMGEMFGRDEGCKPGFDAPKLRRGMDVNIKVKA